MVILNIELPYDLTPLMGIYPKNVRRLSKKDMQTPMFIAA